LDIIPVDETLHPSHLEPMVQHGYRIEIAPHTGAVSAYHGKTLIASSDQVKILFETRLQDYYYFPKNAVAPDILQASNHRTFCPFKGTASYWHVKTPDGLVENGAWSYETPLKESADIGGMISFQRSVVDRYSFENSTPDQDHNDGYINSPLSDWVLREAGYCSTREQLVRALGNKFVESGIAVFRLNITIWSLHPQIAGVNYIWTRDDDEVKISEPGHEVFDNPDFIKSPVNLVTQGLGGVRQPLNVDEAEFEFPIMEKLKSEGATDYVAMPLRFSDGQFHSMTMACDHPKGFTTENLGLVFECSGTISRYFEVLTQRRNSTVLLDTYLGKRTGRKVLNGDIRRGQGEDIRAIILFSDLRNSTLLAQEMARSDYLLLLNTYFETVLGPVGENGGEVLKFIGDAVLAIFPVTNDHNNVLDQAMAALKAAREAVENIKKPANEVGPKLDFGISLHVGEVTYGNVGGRDRLDFTVIGPAVNLASRLESFCKKSGNRIILSSDFNKVISVGADSTPITRLIGSHKFEGIAEKQELYTPV